MPQCLRRHCLDFSGAAETPLRLWDQLAIQLKLYFLERELPRLSLISTPSPQLQITTPRRFLKNNFPFSRKSCVVDVRLRSRLSLENKNIVHHARFVDLLSIGNVVPTTLLSEPTFVKNMKPLC